LFDYNKDKQPQKRKSSEFREKAREKRQLCDDAVQHHELVQNFDFECTTKETQKEPAVTPQKVDIGVQCNIELAQHKKVFVPISSDSETDDKDGADESDFEYHEGYEHDEEYTQDISVTPSKTAFIVYWTSLLILLKHCLSSACNLTTIITKIAYKGSQLIIKMKCPDGHQNTWKSQPNYNHYSIGNLTSAASVLFSANTYQRIANFFDLAGIQWLSKTSYYAIQKRFLLGVVNRNYNERSKEICDNMKKHGVYDVSGDGRCYSPGHNAKYLT